MHNSTKSSKFSRKNTKPNTKQSYKSTGINNTTSTLPKYHQKQNQSSRDLANSSISGSKKLTTPQSRPHSSKTSTTSLKSMNKIWLTTTTNDETHTSALALTMSYSISLLLNLYSTSSPCFWKLWDSGVGLDLFKDGLPSSPLQRESTTSKPMCSTANRLRGWEETRYTGVVICTSPRNKMWTINRLIRKGSRYRRKKTQLSHGDSCYFHISSAIAKSSEGLTTLSLKKKLWSNF